MLGEDAVEMEGPDAAVAWNNAGTYKPLVRETSRIVKEAKKPVPPPAAVSQTKPLSFSKDTIANGIIMAEVLGKPLALRHGRR